LLCRLTYLTTFLKQGAVSQSPGAVPYGPELEAGEGPIDAPTRAIIARRRNRNGPAHALSSARIQHGTVVNPLRARERMRLERRYRPVRAM
jgi:hypothetical protein